MAGLTTESANSDMADCCSKCKAHDGPSFTASQMALTAALSFIAGISLVVLALFILRLERDKRMCFRKKEEPFKGKFEGASKKATFKVLKKHTLERSRDKGRPEAEDQKNEIESAKEPETLEEESAVVTVVTTENEVRLSDGVTNRETENKDTENTKEIERKETANDLEQDIDDKETKDENNMESNDIKDNVKCNNNDDVGDIKESNCQEGKASDQTEVEAAPGNELMRPRDNNALSSQLFEKSRGSSIYEHGDLVIQNDNFRMSALSNI